VAYNVRDEQILGGLTWASSDGYVITAKAEGNPSFEQMRPMLQSLLVDRFNLKLRKEIRDLDAYELTVAKGGLKVAPSQIDSCVTFDRNGPPPPPGSKICGGTRYQIEPGEARIEGFHVSMLQFAQELSDDLGRSIIDRTGLTGTYDIELDFAAEDRAPMGGPMPANPGTQATAASSPAPPLNSAIEEQLGLHLQSVRGPVEVLVIDHVERPSPN
jgi:uncharacterized protein (TIGR03435 family)